MTTTIHGTQANLFLDAAEDVVIAKAGILHQASDVAHQPTSSPDVAPGKWGYSSDLADEIPLQSSTLLRDIFLDILWEEPKKINAVTNCSTFLSFKFKPFYQGIKQRKTRHGIFSPALRTRRTTFDDEMTVSGTLT